MLRLSGSALLILFITGISSADNWPAWRGLHGDGSSAEKKLPLKWSPTENVRWKVKLPGPGSSTPIIWGDRIFLTQSLNKEGSERAVMCFDRSEGKLLWQKSIPFEGKESTHATNPYCSASPVTDGERVIASMGSAGVVCYDFEGKQLWQRDLGIFEHVWGTAAAPILYGDLVILNCGPGERTFLLAMNKKTGEDVWKIEIPGGDRDNKKGGGWIGSWSTPRIVSVDGKDQLIMSWPMAVKAHDPKDGTVLWECEGLTRLVYTSPLISSDAVVAMSGYGGSAVAVKLGGKGDVTTTHRLWHHSKQNPQRIGSGVIVGDHVYMANAGPGTVQCIEVRTGKQLWDTQRLGNSHWGSIVHADGKLFVTDQNGDTHIFAAKPEFESLGKNRLGEHTDASIAISNGELFIRTYQHLWCIGEAKK